MSSASTDCSIIIFPTLHECMEALNTLYNHAFRSPNTCVCPGRKLLETSDRIATFARPAEPIILYEFEGCPFCRKVGLLYPRLASSIESAPHTENVFMWDNALSLPGREKDGYGLVICQLWRFRDVGNLTVYPTATCGRGSA